MAEKLSLMERILGKKKKKNGLGKKVAKRATGAISKRQQSLQDALKGT